MEDSGHKDLKYDKKGGKGGLTGIPPQGSRRKNW